MPKKKRDGKTKKLTRRATFVRGRHLVVDRSGAPARTLNVVQRAALNPDAPTAEGGEWGSPTVFFKPHNDEDAVSQYAVASTRLARFLKMPEVIARNAFAKVKNVRGVVSGAVPGSPLYMVKQEREVQVPQWLWGYTETGERTKPSEQDIRDWLRNNQVAERDGKYYETSSKIFQWVNFKDPRIQKGMSDLQLFDAIGGQLDRHAGNIFVDPQTGAVSGIDDDKSFGKGRPAARQAETSTDYNYYRALPALVDKATAERILALDPTNLPNELLSRENDSRELTEQEIADAVRRFEGVRLYLRQLQKEGKLVGQNGTSWNDATYQQALEDPESSYLGYQAAALEDALQKSANDPMYVVVNAPPPMPLLPPLPPPLATATTTTMTPQPPPIMPPLRQPPLSLWMAGVSPSRAAEVRLAASQRARWVPATPSAVGVDDSGDSSEDSTTSSADDS